MKRFSQGWFWGLGAVFFACPALAADLTVGVVSSSQKVRPADNPTLAQTASIKAARNEFEAFQIIVKAGASDVSQISAKVTTPFSIAADVRLYAARYYDVGVASNDDGAPGLWPDPLVPDVDAYFNEKRNAFPMTVTAGQTGVIWVDVQVPPDAPPGDYTAAIEVDVSGVMQATVPVSLHVGNFSLPSTATLASAFGMGWNTPPLVHCGGAFPYCGGDLDKSNAIRALYLRAALDHRFSISATDFQPPFGGDQAPYEKYVVPLIQGTGPTRLKGAKITSVELDGAPAEYAQWIAYAKTKAFFDRLFAYPIDEPNNNASAWQTFSTDSDALHAADPNALIILTTAIQNAQSFNAADKIDIMCPVLDEMYGRPDGTYPGDNRTKYDAWLATKSSNKLWMYQSCDQHGCGNCGDPSPGPDYSGWPERVIDSTGVQDRAFEWWSFLENTTGELYFETTYQLATAWDNNGQCAFSGSGDGTVFYPGKTSIIGGADDIPIESIRIKLIREGMEDYEYLVQAAAIDPNKTRQIALALFPTPYQCNQPATALESARDQLFAMLDKPGSTGGDGGGTNVDGGTGGDAGTNPSGGSSGCGCTTAGSASTNGVLVALGALALAIVRSGRTASRRRPGRRRTE